MYDIQATVQLRGSAMLAKRHILFTVNFPPLKTSCLMKFLCLVVVAVINGKNSDSYWEIDYIQQANI